MPHVGFLKLAITVKGLGCARLNGGHLSPSTKVVKKKKWNEIHVARALPKPYVVGWFF
jgi:hypothetical protein